MPTILSNPSITAQLKCQLNAGASPAVALSQVNHLPVITPGAGNTPGNIDRCISEPFTVTAGTPFTLNLSTALDPLSSAAGFVHLSAILIENDSTVAGQDFTLGGGAHPALGTDQATAQANGGVILLTNPAPGYPIVSASSDTLQITVAAGTNVPGKITLLGRSA
jgi:hypothetical protein